MRKYYAVKSGRTPGIYFSWEECQAQILGFGNALYKSFDDINDAAAYMESGAICRGEDCGTESHGVGNRSVGNRDTINHSAGNRGADCGDIDGLMPESRTIRAYVDGSYDAATHSFSYGMVIFHAGKEYHFSERYTDPELAAMHNVAGEIKGAEAAMRYAIEHDCTALTIYHDYEGIAKWCLGTWKTNKKATAAYKKYYDSIKNTIRISFVKVKGHSGDKYNEIADKLAKSAFSLR